MINGARNAPVLTNTIPISSPDYAQRCVHAHPAATPFPLHEREDQKLGIVAFGKSTNRRYTPIGSWGQAGLFLKLPGMGLGFAHTLRDIIFVSSTSSAQWSDKLSCTSRHASAVLSFRSYHPQSA